MDQKNIILNGTTGKRLTECRKAANMTQRELAEKSGYTIQHISRIENDNQKLTFETAEKLAKYLNVSSYYLLCKTDMKGGIELDYGLKNPKPALQRFFRIAIELGIYINIDNIDIKDLSLIAWHSELWAMDNPYGKKRFQKLLIDAYKDDTISIGLNINANLDRENFEIPIITLIQLIGDCHSLLRKQSDLFASAIMGKKRASERFIFSEEICDDIATINGVSLSQLKNQNQK